MVVNTVCRSGEAPALVARVCELAELTGDEIRRLLTDVYGVVADPFETARDQDHAQPPLAHFEIVSEVEEAVDDAPVRPVDQLIQFEERFRGHSVAQFQRAQ